MTTRKQWIEAYKRVEKKSDMTPVEYCHYMADHPEERTGPIYEAECLIREQNSVNLNAVVSLIDAMSDAEPLSDAEYEAELNKEVAGKVYASSKEFLSAIGSIDPSTDDEIWDHLKSEGVV